MRSKEFIPGGRQLLDETDLEAVAQVLRSDWLTTGPFVEHFEKAVREFCGTKYGVAVSNGTAALHTAVFAAGFGKGDEVIVTPMTFAASANCLLYQGAMPVFCDVDPRTLLIDPKQIEKKITARTRGIIAVDYAGHPCNYDEIKKIARQNDLIFIADSCHALGAEYRGKRVGGLADLSVFSFHPVKHITSGEGGMVLTNNEEFSTRMKRFRNHGITSDHRTRAKIGTYKYEMLDLGFNYRLTDIQCALGLSQLQKLSQWIEHRQQIAALYDDAFKSFKKTIVPLLVHENVKHAYHLYVVQLQLGNLKDSRDVIFAKLRDQGIGANVHYLPVHLHPYYQKHFGYTAGDFPVAESAYEKILSLPMHAGLTDAQVSRVIEAVTSIAQG